MKFKLDKTVPSKERFGNTHLVIEDISQEEFSTAQQIMESWEAQELAKIPPETLEHLRDHAPKGYGNRGGAGGSHKKKSDAPPSQPGEYQNLVRRLANACGAQLTQDFTSMIWGYVGSYEKDGVLRGPYAKSFDEAQAHANDKGWDWWLSRQVEKLAPIVKSVECGESVTIRYSKGRTQDASGNWADQWAQNTLTPKAREAVPGAEGLPQAAPEDPFAPLTSAPSPPEDDIPF